MKFLIFFTLWLPVVANAFTVPSDEDYYVLKTENYNFIYTKDSLSFLDELVGYNDYFTKLYEREYSWVLDERTSLVLTSPRNQIANGFATVVPNNLTVFYGGGPGLIDFFASPSWVYTLLSHETAHLYQLNVKKSGVSRALKYVFGNTFPISPNLFLGYPWMIHPNQFVPTFMIEGNATYNESRFGLGGRLYSGRLRALMLTLIRDGKINSSRLINDHLDFPYSTEKYLLGGYFNNFLAEVALEDLDLGAKTSEKRRRRKTKKALAEPNRWFYEQSAYFYNPLQLNNSFYKVYRDGYDSLIKDFKSDWRDLAKSQRSADAPSVANSLLFAYMNREGDEIQFLTQPTGREYPILHRYNGKSKSLKTESKALPLGKVFNINKKWSSVGSGAVSPTDIKYTLFREGHYPLEKYYDKVVFDYRNNNLAYADARSGFTEAQLYVNKKRIGPTHSSAILDEKGNVYYFLQKGPYRYLYKNRQSLTRFKGYYGYPVDIGPLGEVYFVAATLAGSSLFSWDRNEIWRLHDSDVIIDGKRVGRNEFFVSEVTSKGYEYKQIKTGGRISQPEWYEYAFEKQKSFTAFEKAAPKVNLSAYESEPYNSFYNLRFSRLEPFFAGSNTNGILTGLTTVFVDPMLFNGFQLTGAVGGEDESAAQFSYQYIKHRLQVGLSGLYERDAVEDNLGNVAAHFEEWQLALGFAYPLTRKGLWSSSLNVDFAFEQEEDLITASTEEYSVKTTYNISRSLSHFLNWERYRHSHLLLSYEREWDKDDSEQVNHIYVGRLDFQYELPWENIFALSYKAAVVDGDQAEIELDSFISQIYSGTTDFTSLSLDDTLNFFELSKLNLTYKLPLNLSLYSKVIPFGLRRFAFVAVYNKFNGRQDRDGNNEASPSEWGGGAEMEFLLFHKFPMRFQFLSAENDVNDETVFTSSVNFTQEF